MIEVRMNLGSSGAAAPELARCLLEKNGIRGQDIAQKNEKGRCYLSVYVKSARGAGTVRAAMRSSGLKGISVSLVRLKDSDWKTRWKKYVVPFRITPEIRVVPVWNRGFRRATADSILIDTTLAFGTGLHATTRMMAGLIRERRGDLGNFLDIGAGSGILSVIASRYGAGTITAIDNDPHTVKTCRRNLAMNYCKGKVMARDLADFRPGRRFDFVAANLLTEDLVRLRSRLVPLVTPGGYLAVSGIYFENYASFRRRFKAANLVCRKVLRQKKWYALLFRKTA